MALDALRGAVQRNSADIALRTDEIMRYEQQIQERRLPTLYVFRDQAEESIVRTAISGLVAGISITLPPPPAETKLGFCARMVLTIGAIVAAGRIGSIIYRTFRKPNPVSTEDPREMLVMSRGLREHLLRNIVQ